MGRVRFRFVPHGGHPTRKMRPIRLYSFNSCPRRRASSPTWELPHISPFQFSPPHGGHRSRTTLRSWRTCFNSRPRTEGILCIPWVALSDRKVSILAPARRASILTHTFNLFPCGFNSRPRTEGIKSDLVNNCTSTAFQFSPPHGGHQLSVNLPINTKMFQFSPPHGGHPPKTTNWTKAGGFNSRPRTEGIVSPSALTWISFSFNSRPRTEGIPDPGREADNKRSFNSRPRTEGILHGLR